MDFAWCSNHADLGTCCISAFHLWTRHQHCQIRQPFAGKREVRDATVDPSSPQTKVQRDLQTHQTTREGHMGTERPTFDYIFKVLDLARYLVDIVKSRHLNEPPDVVRVQFVVHYPFGELVPLVR